jgi:hypothetical protein
MSFKRSDMVYTDGEFYKYYKWSAKQDRDSPSFVKDEHYNQLNRIDGFGVLFFINQFCAKHGLDDIHSFQKAERMIKQDLPETLKIHQEIENWIVINWHKHQAVPAVPAGV